tara:strand:- start:802 stop:1059 length:258 start_codon:yes stop_codon:yes gene_type:complete
MIIEIILGILVLVEGYIIVNLMLKSERLETWLEVFTTTITEVQEELKDIDNNGSFQSDDEVGVIFKQIEETVNKLETLKGEEVNG